VKDRLQLADPLPQLFIFGAKGLQLIAKLSLLLPDEGKRLQLPLIPQTLVVLLLDRIRRGVWIHRILFVYIGVLSGCDMLSFNVLIYVKKISILMYYFVGPGEVVPVEQFGVQEIIIKKSS